MNSHEIEQNVKRMIENFSKENFLYDLLLAQTRISAIIKGRRRITADTALRFSKYFGNTAKFWLGLQDDFDIEEEKLILKLALAAIPRYTNSAA